MSGGSGLESQAGLRFRWVAGFGIAGLLIDLLPVQLTPGLHFSFGGAFALVPGLLFGPLYGAASVLLSQIPHASAVGLLRAVALASALRCLYLVPHDSPPMERVGLRPTLLGCSRTRRLSFVFLTRGR